MKGVNRYLSAGQAAAVYDRIGRWQDAQGFERPAVDALVVAGRFEQATNVVEIGCGTGALAARLLSDHLPATARYTGLDVSARMVSLARDRLQSWTDRAEVIQVDGRSPWPAPDTSCDRVLAAYVLDLLSPEAIHDFFAQAGRVLAPGGAVAVTSLTPGRRGAARRVSAAWSALWQVNPHLTGGCRPVDLSGHLPVDWTTRHSATVISFGVSSQVLVAGPPPS